MPCLARLGRLQGRLLQVVGQAVVGPGGGRHPVNGGDGGRDQRDRSPVQPAALGRSQTVPDGSMDQGVGKGNVGTRSRPVLRHQAGGGCLIKGSERVSQAGQCCGGGQRAAPANDSSRRDQHLGRLGQSPGARQDDTCQCLRSRQILASPRQAARAQLLKERPAVQRVASCVVE
jgi:hypothetical protein